MPGMIRHCLNRLIKCSEQWGTPRISRQADNTLADGDVCCEDGKAGRFTGG